MGVRLPSAALLRYSIPMILIKNADVYSPSHLGVCDVLLGGDKILAVGKNLDVSSVLLSKTIDADGAVLTPGLIDGHVHIIGGGGEDGMLSRVPAIKEKDIANAGVTSLVGLLGTDGATRTVRDLIAKTKALKEWGLSAWALTGSYQVPSPTLTGSVMDDIVFIDEIIGVKVAISDHRCSLPTLEELIRLASSARLASLMSKKCGIVHIHVGAYKDGIAQLFEIAERTPLPLKTFYPTHMGGHTDQAAKWLKMGGHIDITCSDSALNAMEKLVGINDDELTLSTDANGSFPKWNEKKEIVKMGVGSISNLYKSVTGLVSNGLAFEKALTFATSNPARALALKGKGEIKESFDADLLLLKDGKIDTVISRGLILKEGAYLKDNYYEDI